MIKSSRHWDRQRLPKVLSHHMGREVWRAGMVPMLAFGLGLASPIPVTTELGAELVPPVTSQSAVEAMATPAAGTARRYAAVSRYAAPACRLAVFYDDSIRLRGVIRFRSFGWEADTVTLRRWRNPPLINVRGTWWRPADQPVAFKFKAASMRIVAPDEDSRLPHVSRSRWNRLGCPAVRKPFYRNYIGFHRGWTSCAYVGPDKVGLQSLRSSRFRPGFGRYDLWIGTAKERGWANGRLIRYGPPPGMKRQAGPRARLKLDHGAGGLVIRWRSAHKHGESPSLMGVSLGRFERHCPLD